MRDIIWTIIIVWLFWKIYDALKSISKSKKQSRGSNNAYRKEGEVKIDRNVDLKSHFNPNDGEYVDYEDIK